MKKIQVVRRASVTEHIYSQEIQSTIEAIRAATYAKFVAPGQVFLGGFEKAKEELVLIDNLVIAANGASKIAAEYGQFVMRALGPLFNSVSVVEGHEISSQNLHLKKFAGYLTLS